MRLVAAKRNAFLFDDGYRRGVMGVLSFAQSSAHFLRVLEDLPYTPDPPAKKQMPFLSPRFPIRNAEVAKVWTTKPWPGYCHSWTRPQSLSSEASSAMADTKTIIQTLFQAMVRHRPGLANFLTMVEDGTFDVRELADQVVKGFPYPVGVELRRLFSSEHNRPDRGQLDQRFKTIERTLQFAAFVLLSQLLEEGRGRTLSRCGPLFERLAKPAGLTMGDFTYFSCPRWRRCWARGSIPSFTSGRRSATRSAII